MSPRQPIKWSYLDKSHMKHGGLLNKHFCKKKSNILNYTKPKSQRNCELFFKFCTSRACFNQNVFKKVKPSYLSIFWAISFNRQCLDPEETTKFVEVGCL